MDRMKFVPNPCEHYNEHFAIGIKFSTQFTETTRKEGEKGGIRWGLTQGEGAAQVGEGEEAQVVLRARRSHLFFAGEGKKLSSLANHGGAAACC